jgi:hypothetical protein
MTTTTRRQAPDERAAKDDENTPPSSTPQPSPTKTTLTQPSPPRENHGITPTSLTNTFIAKKCELEVACLHLATLESSPSVRERFQALQKICTPQQPIQPNNLKHTIPQPHQIHAKWKRMTNLLLPKTSQLHQPESPTL